MSSEKLPIRIMSNEALGISLNNSTGITHSLGVLMPSETISVKSKLVIVSFANSKFPVPFVQSEISWLF